MISQQITSQERPPPRRAQCRDTPTAATASKRAIPRAARRPKNTGSVWMPAARSPSVSFTSMRISRCRMQQKRYAHGSATALSPAEPWQHTCTQSIGRCSPSCNHHQHHVIFMLPGTVLLLSSASAYCVQCIKSEQRCAKLECLHDARDSKASRVNYIFTDQRCPDDKVRALSLVSLMSMVWGCSHRSSRQGARNRRESDDCCHSNIFHGRHALQQRRVQQSGTRREGDDESQQWGLLHMTMYFSLTWLHQ